MEMEIELPYIDLREATELDPRYVTSFDVRPLDEDKRIRVYGTQLLDDVIEDTNLCNFYFKVYVYYKQGLRLEKRFPHRRQDIEIAYERFWIEMQMRYKRLIEEQRCEQVYNQQIYQQQTSNQMK